MEHQKDYNLISLKKNFNIQSHSTCFHNAIIKSDDQVNVYVLPHER